MAFYISLISMILWFIFMTYLSHQDGEHTGRASRELAEHLRFLDADINDLNGKLRWAAHIVVFAVFVHVGAYSQDWRGIAGVDDDGSSVELCGRGHEAVDTGTAFFVV